MLTFGAEQCQEGGSKNMLTITMKRGHVILYSLHWPFKETLTCCKFLERGEIILRSCDGKIPFHYGLMNFELFC